MAHQHRRTPFVELVDGFSDHLTGQVTDFMIAGLVDTEGNARGWQPAKCAQAHAADLHVKYIIFDAKVWRAYAPERGWGTYTHPYGNSSPTLAHRDHVHVLLRDLLCRD